MRRAALAALCAFILAASQAFADEQPSKVSVGGTDPSGFPNIKTSVVVTNSAGLPITGLKQSDFSVIEDGATVPVTSIQTINTLPVDMTAVLVVDTSGSMAGKPLEDAVGAANRFVDQMGPGAQVGGVTLGGQCFVNSGPGLSKDKAAVKDFFTPAQAGGDTPLYDATLTAIQQTLTAPQGTRMVIVLTDGEDTCSKISFDTLVNSAVHNNVPLTFIGLGPDIKPDILQNLANLTGGQFMSADDSSKLAEIYDGLTTRLRTQYALQFHSGQFADRHEHTFSVHVKSDAVEANGDSRFTTPAIAPRPQLTLTAGQKVSEPVTFDITNQSPVQLAHADVYLDDTLLENLSGTSLSYTLDPSGLSAGTHSVRVHVADSTGAEADVVVPVELVDTGVFGRIPFWAILGLVLLLPILALVGVFVVGGRRRALRCANCHRPLERGWAACPYCSQPEPTPVAVAGPITSDIAEPQPRQVVDLGSPMSNNGHTLAGDHVQRGDPTLVGRHGAPQPAGPAKATQLLSVEQAPGAWLIISAGDQTGTRFRLGTEETVIGRDGDNDVVLDDVGASRQHARIRRTPSGFQLTDLDTTNGTRLNGKTIHREMLRQGDVIEIGTTRLSFVTISPPKA